MVDGGLLSTSSVLMASLAGPLDDASQLIFYREINSLLSDAFRDYGARLFERAPMCQLPPVSG